MEAAGDSDDGVNIFDSLEETLYKCMVRTENGRRFIPNGALEEHLDDETMQKAIAALKLHVQSDTTVRALMRKILALLILTKWHRALESFVKLEITDMDLPMPDPVIYSSSGPESLHGLGSTVPIEQSSKWFSLWKSQSGQPHFDELFSKQWLLLAPSFSRGANINHYEFNKNHILPFMPIESGSIPFSGYDLIGDQPRAGGYGEVRRIKIHPKHYDFGPMDMGAQNDLFAIKRLHTHVSEEFKNEISIMKRLKRFKHPHIVELLTTFDISERHDDISGTTYHLIFPLASGNLRDFWESKTNLVGKQLILPWISLQCQGLASALALIHGGGNEEPTLEDQALHGRHGDIKPSNILWFTSPYEGEPGPSTPGRLVLADFGHSELSRRISRSDISASEIHGPLTYRAPETEMLTHFSRKTDIWMLGCTFLMFITWFLLGPAALVEFSNFRKEENEHGIYSDTFFCVRKRGGKRVARVKRQVAHWIRRLSRLPDCDHYLQSFLGLVKDKMLVVSQSGRLDAATLVKTLEDMDREYIHNQPVAGIGAGLGVGGHERRSIGAAKGIRMAFMQCWRG